MKKTDIMAVMLTGRKFLCIHETNDLLESFNIHFKVGHEYFEAKHDSSGKILEDTDVEYILLVSEYGLPLFLFAEGFVLLKDD